MCIPIVLILLQHTIHVDGQVAVPVRTTLHMGQPGELCHEQTVTAQRCEGDNPFHPQHSVPGVEGLQSLGDEIFHPDGIAYRDIQACSGIVREDHVLPVKAFALPFFHRSHKGVGDGVAFTRETVDKIGEVAMGWCRGAEVVHDGFGDEHAVAGERRVGDVDARSFGSPTCCQLLIADVVVRKDKIDFPFQFHLFGKAATVDKDVQGQGLLVP